jgi:ADP-heptose:LPS heptosyltransferase
VTAILSGLSGAKVRVGFFNPRSEGLYRGFLLTHPVAYNPHIHIAKNMIALTEPIAAQDNMCGPLLRRIIEDKEILLKTVTPSKEAQDRVKAIINRRVQSQGGRRFFLVNINAGDFLPQRKWPKDSFEQFIKILLNEHPEITVLLTGSPKERAGVETVAQKFGERCFNIAGDLEFEDLTALYSISEGLLTNDSGPGHFASAVGIKSFVLFGPETPALYGPINNSTPIYAGLACSPCVYATNHRDTTCTDNQCLKVISPEFVFNQVSQHLKAHA